MHLKTIDKEQLNVVIDGVEQTSPASRRVVSALYLTEPAFLWCENAINLS